jgi:hypothetical protein
VKFVFYCSGCQSEKTIDNPINVELPCVCGGISRLRTTGEARTKKELDAEPCATGGGTIYELLVGSNTWFNKPRTGLKRYKTAMCRSCGSIQVTAAKEYLTCRSCGKKHEFRKNGTWHVKLKDFDDFLEAQDYLKEWTLRGY